MGYGGEKIHGGLKASLDMKLMGMNWDISVSSMEHWRG